MTDKELALPAIVEKQMLGGIVRLRGGINSDPVTIGATAYAKDTLVFLGFAGRINVKTGLYEGAYMFRVVQPKDADNNALRVADLPRAATHSSKAKGAPKKTESEVKHGV